MKSNIVVLLAVLTGLIPNARAATEVWWRLDEEAPPVHAAEGGPDLKWWSEGSHPYYSTDSVPPDSLYQLGKQPPARSFSPAASCLNSPGGLMAAAPADFSGRSGGLVIEGFFSTIQVKDKLENQAVVVCGDGWLDASWAVRLIDGRPAFSIYREGDANPVAQVEIPSDVRDGKWHFFVARVHPDPSGRPAQLSLSVASPGEATGTASLDLPEGIDIRQHDKPLIIGRSSLYIDNQPNYKGTWDTFQGSISDIRISSGEVTDSELLGRVDD